MKLRIPILKDLLSGLFRKPETNPFPAPHLPASVGGFLSSVQSGQTEWKPVPIPADARFKLTYDKASCIGCKMCITVCPAHAIEMIPGQKKVRIFLGQCISCAQCTEVCPKKCLAMNGDFLQADTDRYSKALVLD